MIGGSVNQDEAAQIVVDIEEPVNLIEVLKQMPLVEEAAGNEGGIRVALKPAHPPGQL